jgi:hypothetical protein
VIPFSIKTNANYFMLFLVFTARSFHPLFFKGRMRAKQRAKPALICRVVPASALAELIL